MAYSYSNGTFSGKDALPPDDVDKIITGSLFETEFVAIEAASVASDAAIILKMPLTGGAFSGHVTGTTITLSGAFEALSIDGGTY